MKILKRFVVLILSITIAPSVFACGGGWYEASYDNIYRIDYMLQDGMLGETYHNHQNEFAGNAVEDNLKEWQEFFGGRFSQELLADLIYTEEEQADVVKIQTSLKGIDGQTKAWFKDYMVIAKQAETISNAYDPWSYYRDDERVINQGLINKLTKDIIANIKIVN